MVSESDIRGCTDDPAGIFLFVSELPTNCQHKFPEGRDAKNTVPL